MSHIFLQLTFENIGQLFLSLEPGPLLDTVDKLFDGLVKGVRAQPFNIPGFAFHHALQVFILTPNIPLNIITSTLTSTLCPMRKYECE